MENTTITRLQLYELVWQEPISKLATTLGISPVTLANTCRRLQIPLPERGYWQKRAAGHQLSRRDLAQGPGFATKISFRRPLVKVPRALATERSNASHDVPNASAVVLSKLSNPHPLVARCRGQLMNQSADLYGLRKATPVAGFSVRVSSATEVRAFAIVDTIFKVLLRAKIKIEVKARENARSGGDHYFAVGGQEIQLSIRENYVQKQKSDAECDKERAAGKLWVAKMHYSTTGKLRLKIENKPSGYRANWMDSDISLDSQVGEVVRALQTVPDLVERHGNQLKEQEQNRRDDYERRSAQQRQLEHRKEDLQVLLKEASSYRDYVMLLTYLDQLEDRFRARADSNDAGFWQKIAEARQLAAELDFTEKRIDLLQKNVPLQKY